MEMQIPQLRELFEARVGQIANVLAQDPPAELGRIDPTMRGLKGFLFTLEGMLRKDELQGLPFTARQELFDRVGRAIDAIQALPKVLNREQALEVLHAMDSLHRLCLQENLMASGLDASKLGKLTVILERKLGDVLETIDGVAGTGEGHVRQIEEAAGQCIADIQGVYEKEAQVLASSASSAVETIRSEAETIRTRRAEAMEAIDALQQELAQKRRDCQEQLEAHLGSVRQVVERARGDQSSAGELLARAREQLDQARGAIEAMADLAQAARAAREELEAKLTEGRDVVASIRELLSAGTEASAGISDKVARADEHLAGIQQAGERCAELSDEARQQQARAIAAVQGAVEAADRMEAEARQKLDEQLRAAADVLAQITSHGAEAGEASAEVQQHRQAAAEAGQGVSADAQAAAQTRRNAEEALAALQALLAESHKGAAQLDDLVRAGGEMSARLAEMQAQATQSRERIGHLADEASQAADAVRATAEAAEGIEAETRQKLDEQLQTSGRVLAEIESSATAALAEVRGHLAAAGEAVQAMSAHAQAADDTRRHADEALTQLRELLARGQEDAAQLDGLAHAGSDLKARLAQTLTEARQSRQRIGQLADEASQEAEAIRQQKDEAVTVAREAIGQVEHAHRQFAQVVTEQGQAARDAVASLRGDQATGADLLARTREALEALQGEMQQIHAVRQAAGDAQADLRAMLDRGVGVAEELGAVLAKVGELRAQVERHLAGSAEARGRLEGLVEDTSAAAGDLRRRHEEVLAGVRDEAQAARARHKATETSVAELLESARSVVVDMDALKASAEEMLAQGRRRHDEAQAAARGTAEARAATAEASGEIQGRLQDARRAAADIEALLAAGTEGRSKIDAELTAARQAADQAGTIRRELGELSDRVRGHDEALSEARAQSQQVIAEIRRGGREALDSLAGQNSDLVARGEQLQQELEDLFGQAADGGLFKQFDDLAARSAPQRAKWLRLLIGGGAGGAVVLAVAASLLAGVSAAAAWAVLAAGGMPLAIFLVFCTAQYNAERRAEERYRYRGALSRSLTAYRKLLATMKAEGVADSALVDRMLSELFGAVDEAPDAREDDADSSEQSSVETD